VFRNWTAPTRDGPQRLARHRLSVDLPRSVLCALLDLLETDPDLRERARQVLGVGVALSTPAYVTRQQASKMGVEVRALIRAERSGDLQAFKVGRAKVYRLADVEGLVEGHPVAGAGATRGVAPAPAEAADPWARAVALAAKRKAAGGQ
jgi:hypothetical protein